MDQPKLTWLKEGAAFLLGDGGPPVVSYVTFQEATGKTASVANLARRVRKLSLETWLLVCSQLLLQDALDHPAAQQQVFNSLPRDVQGRIVRFEGKRVLLFPQRVHGVMRAALLYARRGAPSDSLAEHVEDVAMAILEADAFDLDARRGMSGEERIRSLVVSKILRLEGRRRSLPRLDVGRTHRLFVELARELSAVEEVAHARLLETFEVDAGMTLLRHTAIRFALYARLSNVDVEHEPMLISPAYFKETAIDPEEARRVLRELAIPVDALRDATRALKKSDTFELFDPRPFASYPLIEINEDVFVPSDPAMLLVRLIGDGIWWRMRLGYRAQRDGQAVFQAAVGRLFETYLGELTSEAFGSTVGVFGEAEYRRGALGLDLTVSCPEALLAVEAGVQRPHVESMFLAAAPGAFERSVEDIIVPRVRGQLARKARMLASCEIPRPPGGQNKPILPVLVLIDGFPQGPVLNDSIVRAGRAEGLGTDGIHDLVVLGAAEWEALCGVVEARHVSPAAVIMAWKRAATDADFLDVLDSQFGGSLVPTYVARASDRAFEQWSSELGMTAPA